MSATDASNREIEHARSLQQDLRALFDAYQPDQDGTQRLEEVRRLCATLAIDDRYCHDALRAVESCAVYYFWSEENDRRSRSRRSRLRTLILRLLEALHSRLLEIEARSRLLAIESVGAGAAVEFAESRYCDVGGRRIPIVMQDRNGRTAHDTLRSFTGGEEGPQEAGIFSFWSVLEGPVSIFIFRNPIGRPVEERLREYVGKTARRAELMHEFGDRVMPSTVDEVALWLKAHPVDASFAVSHPGSTLAGAAS